jgi:hypothetical protein
LTPSSSLLAGAVKTIRAPAAANFKDRLRLSVIIVDLLSSLHDLKQG